ncbi:MAG: hypothetical protein QNJ64_05065, partial [Crocosphaera sp.]|nr:hypothetical protein [Crocosphaera sp.]
MGKIATQLATKNAEFKRFFLGQFPEVQLKAGNSEQYYLKLTNFDFISLKINHPNFGIEPLIRDYNLIDSVAEETLNSEELKTLKYIQRTLQLSSHILKEDPTQLAGQLWGRLLGFNGPDINRLLNDAKDSNRNRIWFRPLTSSLTTPNSPLIHTFIGHNHSVNAVCVTPDGLKVVSASDDKTLKLWDLLTGKELLTLTGHNDSVNGVCVTPDGLKVVSASADETLKLWDLLTGEQLLTLTGHNDSVNGVCVTPDG